MSLVNATLPITETCSSGNHSHVVLAMDQWLNAKIRVKVKKLMQVGIKEFDFIEKSLNKLCTQLAIVATADYID